MIKRRYKTNEEASEATKKFNNKHTPNKLCPLFKSKCNKSCVCYEEFHVRDSCKNYVNGGYCNNRMFGSEMSVFTDISRD